MVPLVLVMCNKGDKHDPLQVSLPFTIIVVKPLLSVVWNELAWHLNLIVVQQHKWVNARCWHTKVQRKG